MLSCVMICRENTSKRRQKGDSWGQLRGTAKNMSSTSDFATFGEALRFFRRQQQLTQQELAQQVGFSREQITKLENNQRTPDLVTVQALFIPALALDPNSKQAQELVTLAGRARPPNTPPSHQSDLQRRTNLTEPLTRFIGRENQIAQVKQLLENTRFLTLTGAGGVGKTRLAIQVGLALIPNFRDGVWLVELAPINDPALVSTTVAAALNLPITAGRSAEQVLTEHLGSRQLLLILDNCEHLLVACSRLAETLLRAAPQLVILATSRESLGVLSATSWRVPSLALPAPNASIEKLQATEAVQLFLDRAASNKPDLQLTSENAPYVSEICQRLDGVPLAIELAASRVRTLALEQIGRRLSDRFRLLTGGDVTALPRHRTLRALIDWSYELLSPAERALFNGLAVFSDCDIDAVEALFGTDAVETLSSLVDKSLVTLDERRDFTRYRLLETLREYGLEKLAAQNELNAARNRHLNYYVALVEEHDPQLRGHAQKEWYARFDVEQDNFRAALDWAIRSENAESGMRMVAALWFYWFWRGHWAEGATRAKQVLEIPGRVNPRLRARALIGASNLPGRVGDYATYGQWLGEGTQLAEQLHDEEQIAWARVNGSFGVRDYAAASRLLEQALGYARKTNDIWFQGEILHVCGERAHGIRDLDRMQALYTESLRCFRTAGDQERVATLLGNLGRLLYERGDYARARTTFAESVALARDHNDRFGAANWQLQMAAVALKLNHLGDVLPALAECLPTFYDVDDQEAIADCFVIVANLANSTGHSERAARLLGAADRVLERFNLLHQVVNPGNYDEFIRAVSETQTHLSESLYITEWEQGRGLALPEAIAFALNSDELRAL